MPSLLTVTGVTKRYGGVLALDAVDFSVNSGEVHALMGENGAGKSTLSRIIAGVTAFDSGKFEFDGRPASVSSPLEAQRMGIAIIFQELDLFPNLSVAENMVLGNLRFKSGLLADRPKMLEFADPYLKEVGLEFVGSELVGQLSIAQQQLVAIARALSMSARLILMDEPTSSLTQEAADRLFQLIAQLRSKGVSIVYVSHKMDEILRICDRMTVLRDGRLVGTRERASTDPSELTRELIRMMVGRHIELSQRTHQMPSTKPLLVVDALTTRKLKQVSFTLHEGEVLGIAGLVGAGRSELGAAIFGLDPILGGKIALRGSPLEVRSAAEAMRKGIGLLPEDRKHEGLMMQMSVLENTTLTTLPRVSRGGLLLRRAEAESVHGMKDRLRLKCASIDQDVSLLSGGNQQKALLARWLMLDPDVLFLDEPTRGIDVGAKEDIYRVIEELAAQGKGILLASSELPELLRCCHRILVLKEGSATALLDGDSATQEAIMDAAAAGIRVA